MAEYDNTNTGILTRSTRQRNDKDPSHQGSLNIEGREFWISAWVNEGKAGGKLEGQKYFSIKVKPKDDASAKPAPRAAPAPAGHDFDDEIPFNQYQRRTAI